MKAKNKSHLIGTALLLTVLIAPASGQECSEFQKAFTATAAASDDLDAQVKRYKQTSETPQYDAGVCTAAKQLAERAAAAAALASANCDPNHIADSISQLRQGAESEMKLFCTREPVAPAGGAAAGGFVFPDSDRRLLTRADVAGLSATQLRMARNEIYARRGRYFKSDDLKQHFESFAWYKPYTWDPTLNAIESQNVQIILDAERRR